VFSSFQGYFQLMMMRFLACLLLELLTQEWLRIGKQERKFRTKDWPRYHITYAWDWNLRAARKDDILLAGILRRKKISYFITFTIKRNQLLIMWSIFNPMRHMSLPVQRIEREWLHIEFQCISTSLK
jgi:hypothetical protein